MYGKTYRAWSTMLCSKAKGIRMEPEDHQPHVWESDYTMYGPYFCTGRNAVPPYEPKHRGEYKEES